jgi:cyclopropane fatty-acyl-phospholipid synthase-like methyltransferase
MIVSTTHKNNGTTRKSLQRHLPTFLLGMMVTLMLRNFGTTIQIVQIHADLPARGGVGMATNDARSKLTCPTISESERRGLEQEISDYEKSSRFQDKILEVRGELDAAIHHKAIDAYLREKVLQPNWSVLELGCAAGKMIAMVESWYNTQNHPHKELVGVELVPGWVDFAKSYFPSQGSSIRVHPGDVTDFTPLPEPHATTTFDLVMLNDVAEHIQKDRYGCFFQQLQRVTHRNSLVYFHTPNPQAQLKDATQSYENVLPHAYLVNGMAQHGFELVTMEQDVETDAGNTKMSDDTHTMSHLRKNTKCEKNGYPKYYHAVFRRVPPRMQSVFELQ